MAADAQLPQHEINNKLDRLLVEAEDLFYAKSTSTSLDRTARCRKVLELCDEALKMGSDVVSDDFPITFWFLQAKCNRQLGIGDGKSIELLRIILRNLEQAKTQKPQVIIDWRFNLTKALLSAYERDKKRTKELKEVADLLRKNISTHTDSDAYRRSLLSLSFALVKQSQLDGLDELERQSLLSQAEGFSQKGIAELERSLAKKNSQSNTELLLEARTNLARIFHRQGKFSDAEKLFVSLQSTLKESTAKNSNELAGLTERYLASYYEKTIRTASPSPAPSPKLGHASPASKPVIVDEKPVADTLVDVGRPRLELPKQRQLQDSHRNQSQAEALRSKSSDHAKRRSLPTDLPASKPTERRRAVKITHEGQGKPLAPLDAAAVVSSRRDEKLDCPESLAISQEGQSCNRRQSSPAQSSLGQAKIVPTSTGVFKPVSPEHNEKSAKPAAARTISEGTKHDAGTKIRPKIDTVIANPPVTQPKPGLDLVAHACPTSPRTSPKPQLYVSPPAAEPKPVSDAVVYASQDPIWTSVWPQRSRGRAVSEVLLSDVRAQSVDARLQPAVTAPQEPSSPVPSTLDLVQKHDQALGELYSENEQISSKAKSWAKEWFLQLRKWTHTVLLEYHDSTNVRKQKEHVKILIVDSGYDQHRTDILKVKNQFKGFKDCVTPNNTDPHDCHSKQHGTNCASLLARVAPRAHIYVANVVEKDKPSMKAMCDALDWAVVLDVDIVSMSCGFNEVHHELRRKLELVKAMQKLIIVAVPNSKSDINDDANYPTFDNSVLSINARKFTWTEDARPFSKVEGNILFPGENVPILGNDNKQIAGTELLTGTSFATPLAAGTMALILDLFLRVDSKGGKSSNEYLNLLQPRHAGLVFREMSDKVQQNIWSYNVMPWLMLGRKKQMEGGDDEPRAVSSHRLFAASIIKYTMERGPQ